MSKAIRDYMAKHPDKFAEYWNEDHNDRYLDYWVICKAPYFSPASETPTIHEDTVKDTLAAMRGVIRGVDAGYRWVAAE